MRSARESKDLHLFPALYQDASSLAPNPVYPFFEKSSTRRSRAPFARKPNPSSREMKSFLKGKFPTFYSWQTQLPDYGDTEWSKNLYPRMLYPL